MMNGMSSNNYALSVILPAALNYLVVNAAFPTGAIFSPC